MSECAKTVYQKVYVNVALYFFSLNWRYIALFF